MATTKRKAKTARKAPAKKARKAPAKKKTAARSAAKQETMTLRQLSAELAEAHDLPRKQANEIMEDMVDIITKQLKKGNRIRISGLGILQVRKRKARMGRNPATGETIRIKASKKVAFRAAKDLKEAV